MAKLDPILRPSSVGPLHWAPPKGLNDEWDRSYSRHEGFSLMGDNPRQGGDRHPRLRSRRLTFAEARQVAEALDRIGTVPYSDHQFAERRGEAPAPTSALAWVHQIIAAIPDAYGLVLEQRRADVERLAALQGEARGFAEAQKSASRVEHPADCGCDTCVPF